MLTSGDKEELYTSLEYCCIPLMTQSKSLVKGGGVILIAGNMRRTARSGTVMRVMIREHEIQGDFIRGIIEFLLMKQPTGIS